MCKTNAEMVRHLFPECELSKQVYALMNTAYHIRMQDYQQPMHPIINTHFTKRERSLFLIATFVIWRERCARTFRGDRMQGTGTDGTDTTAMEFKFKWQQTNITHN